MQFGLDIGIMATHILFNVRKFPLGDARITHFELLLCIAVVLVIAVNLIWAGFFNKELLENDKISNICHDSTATD